MVATSTPTPPAPPVSPAAAALLDEARRALVWRVYFRELPIAGQDAAVLELARHIAIARSPIGKLAEAASERLVDFMDAMTAFTSAYKDDAAAARATHAALEDAGLLGLKTDPRWGNETFQADHFRNVPVFMKSLWNVLDSLCDRFDPCDGPELKFADEGGAA